MNAHHLTNGTSLDEWLSNVANELPIDAVGLWQLSRTLRGGFGLQEPELSIFVRKGVDALLLAGAIPVVGSTGDNQWHRAPGFESEARDTAERIAEYLQRLGRDPDLGDLWFALPRFVKADSR